MQLFRNPLHYSFQAKPSHFESKRGFAFFTLYFLCEFSKTNQDHLIWKVRCKILHCILVLAVFLAAASCSCVFVVVVSHPSIKRLPVITVNLIFKKKKWKWVLCCWTLRKKIPPHWFLFVWWIICCNVSQMSQHVSCCKHFFVLFWKTVNQGLG